MTSLKSMEARLQAQSALHFLPYIGPEYGVAAPRIAMLGEAAHGPAPAGQNRSFVRSVVRTALDEIAKGMKGDHWIRYIRNIEAMLGGREYGAPEHCWQKLAYAVFFQRIKTNPGDGHTPEDIRRGREAFSALLDILAPDYLIVWGQTLLKNGWLPQEGLTTLEVSLPLYVYADHPHTLIWQCHHPSRDFSYRNEHTRWLAVQKTAAARDGAS